MESYFPPMEENRSRIARERMLADLSAIMADTEALLQATAADASDQAKATRARLTEALNKARATFEEFKNEQIDAAKAALTKADQTVRAHPYESLAIAFGVGLLVGVILRRK
jgi:ElaB/YqjD/DUF883 family membrane-anchored ribosome-binding protein